MNSRIRTAVGFVVGVVGLAGLAFLPKPWLLAGGLAFVVGVGLIFCTRGQEEQSGAGDRQ